MTHPVETDKEYGLAGIEPECGCVTAAMSLSASEEEIGRFYLDMAKSGRVVRRMESDVIRAKWGRCPHQGAKDRERQ